MATVVESLKSVNAYPVPLRTLVETAEKRGLDLDKPATAEVLKGKEYNLAKADLYLWLSLSLLTFHRAGSHSLSRMNREHG